MFNFVGGVDDAASLLVGLNGYKYCKDDPVISLSLSDGTELSFTESHENWAGAVSSHRAGARAGAARSHWTGAVSSYGKEEVIVEMGVLLGADFSGSATGLSVTETKGHLYVNSIAYTEQTVPEPATVAMLSFGWMLLLSVRKRVLRA